MRAWMYRVIVIIIIIIIIHSFDGEGGREGEAGVEFRKCIYIRGLEKEKRDGGVGQAGRTKTTTTRERDIDENESRAESRRLGLDKEGAEWGRSTAPPFSLGPRTIADESTAVNRRRPTAHDA